MTIRKKLAMELSEALKTAFNINIEGTEEEYMALPENTYVPGPWAGSSIPIIIDFRSEHWPKTTVKEGCPTFYFPFPMKHP